MKLRPAREATAEREAARAEEEAAAEEAAEEEAAAEEAATVGAGASAEAAGRAGASAAAAGGAGASAGAASGLEADLAIAEKELAAVRAENDRLARKLGTEATHHEDPGAAVPARRLRIEASQDPYRSEDRELALQRALAKTESLLAHERMENAILTSQTETRRTRLSVSLRGAGLFAGAVAVLGLFAGLALWTDNFGMFVAPTVVFGLFAAIVWFIREIPPREGPPPPPNLGIPR